MTPSSPLGGLFTGLIDGLIVAILVFVVVQLTARRYRTAPIATHPVAEDLPATEHELAPEGNLHRAA